MHCNSINIELNLDENGIAEYVTPNLHGTIDYIIILPQNPVDVEIRSKEVPEFVILKTHVYRPEIFPIRMQTRDSDGKHFSFGTDKIPVNEELLVRIKGTPSVVIKMKLCWSDYAGTNN
jgi:hypothetical protein